MSGAPLDPAPYDPARYDPARYEALPFAGLAERVLDAIVARGDLGHLALLAWALAASFFAVLLQREAVAASRRFDAFVRELARFNRSLSGDEP